MSNPYVKAKRALKTLESRTILDGRCLHCDEPVICFRDTQAVEHAEQCPIRHIGHVLGLIDESPSFGCAYEETEPYDYAKRLYDL